MSVENPRISRPLRAVVSWKTSISQGQLCGDSNLIAIYDITVVPDFYFREAKAPSDRMIFLLVVFDGPANIGFYSEEVYCTLCFRSG